MTGLVDRDEARRLTEATVPGEWCYIPGNGIGLRGSTFLLVQDEGLTENNGRFIAAARQLVPGLLGELDAATTALATAAKLHYADGYGSGPDYDCMTCGHESGWPCATARALGVS